MFSPAQWECGIVWCIGGEGEGDQEEGYNHDEDNHDNDNDDNTEAIKLKQHLTLAKKRSMLEYIRHIAVKYEVT